jgi:hypothetical protein
MAFSFPPTNSKQLSTTISDTHKKYKKKRKKILGFLNGI